MKQCKYCGHEKELHVQRLWTDGIYRPTCKGSHKEYYSDECGCQKFEPAGPSEIPI
jgi:hypothetical protein